MPECLELSALCTLLRRLIKTGSPETQPDTILHFCIYRNDTIGIRYQVTSIETKGKHLLFYSGRNDLIDVHFMLKGNIKIHVGSHVTKDEHVIARFFVFPHQEFPVTDETQIQPVKYTFDFIDSMEELEFRHTDCIRDIKTTFFTADYVYQEMTTTTTNQIEQQEYREFQELAKNQSIKTLFSRQSTGPYTGIGKFICKLWVSVLRQRNPLYSESSKAQLVTNELFTWTNRITRNLLKTEHDYLVNVPASDGDVFLIERINNLFALAYSRRPNMFSMIHSQGAVIQHTHM